MKEYLITLLVVSAAAAICGELTYRSADGGYRFAAGILVAYAILSPLSEVIESFRIEDFIVIGDAELEDSEAYEAARDAFCLGIEQAVCQEFSISEDNISVFVSGFDVRRMRCERITVFLSGKGIFTDYERIKSFVGGLGYGECMLEAEI